MLRCSPYVPLSAEGTTHIWLISVVEIYSCLISKSRWILNTIFTIDSFLCRIKGQVVLNCWTFIGFYITRTRSKKARYMLGEYKIDNFSVSEELIIYFYYNKQWVKRYLIRNYNFMLFLYLTNSFRQIKAKYYVTVVKWGTKGGAEWGRCLFDIFLEHMGVWIIKWSQ